MAMSKRQQGFLSLLFVGSYLTGQYFGTHWWSVLWFILGICTMHIIEWAISKTGDDGEQGGE